MDKNEVIKILLNEQTCVKTADTCDRDCAKCSLVMDSEKIIEAYNLAIKLLSEQHWIPCSERLPEEYGEYRITWTTSASKKRLIGDSEFEVTSEWDSEHYRFKGEWLLDNYIKNYPDVKVLAWKPLEEPWEGEQP